jgi:diguanylate cyclase (GGDEF)-like protein/PAS domain S-box-containing protein
MCHSSLCDRPMYLHCVFKPRPLERRLAPKEDAAFVTATTAGRRELPAPSDRALLAQMPDGVLVCDAKGKILFANGQAERLTGYARGDLVGRPIELLVPIRLRAVHRKERQGFFVSHSGPRRMGTPDRDFRVRRKDGTEFSADIALGPVHGPAGPQMVAVVRDITERRDLETALEHRALHDPLTDLANRHLFFDRLHQAMLSGQRDRKLVALVMFDLDGFKGVNDAHGHLVGDQLLKQVALRLQAPLRATDTAARIGGDEFAWILSRIAAPAAAERLVQRLIRPLRRSYAVRRRTMRLGISVGVALFPNDGRDVDTLIRNADSAMYSAKRKGGGISLFRDMALGPGPD